MEVKDDDLEMVREGRKWALEAWQELRDKDVRVVGMAITTLAAIYLTGFTVRENRGHMFTALCNTIEIMYSRLCGDPILGKEFEVVYGPDAAEQMAEDPKLAEFARDTTARMQQVLHDTDISDPDAIRKALAGIGMTPVDPGDMDEIEDATETLDKRKPN